MHYSVIIISHNYQNNNQNYLIIKDFVSLENDCTLIYNKERITFDYLIITDISLVSNLKQIGVLTENKIPVTNYEKQTSIENIYYGSNLDIEEIINNL